jgi:hypothetical protein
MTMVLKPSFRACREISFGKFLLRDLSTLLEMTTAKRSLDTARDDDFSGGDGRGFLLARLLVPLLARLLELFVQDRCGSREERSQDHPRVVIDVSPSPVKNVRRILPREDKSRQPLNGQRCLLLTAG